MIAITVVKEQKPCYHQYHKNGTNDVHVKGKSCRRTHLHIARGSVEVLILIKFVL